MDPHAVSVNFVDATRCFQRNCERLRERFPRLVSRLEQLPEESVIWERHGAEADLRVHDPFGEEWWLHGKQGPFQDAEKWRETLPLEEGVCTLIVYGIGSGSYYLQIEEWLRQNPEHQVLFLEDDVRVLHAFFHLPVSEALLEDPQAQIYLLDLHYEESALFRWLRWFCSFRKILVCALHSYTEHKNNEYRHLASFITNAQYAHNRLAREFLQGGVSVYRHVYPNFLQLHRSLQGDCLQGQFRGVPAILCGAGPSLDRNFSSLLSLQDKALFFAGGSAINALSNRGLIPHFGAVLDPNPEQVKRGKTHSAFEMPVFYKNRVHHEVLDSIHAPRLYMQGCQGYPLVDWIEEKVGWSRRQVPPEGENVMLWCLHLAHFLGCNPIIFVGMDLAYTDERLYATNILREIPLEYSEDGECIETQDIYGKPVRTLWKWLRESEAIGAFAKENPNCYLFNATGGGIGFPGVPHGSIDELELTRSDPLQGWVHALLQQPFPPIQQEKVKETLQELADSFYRCLYRLQIMLQGIQSREALLAEAELVNEPAYELLLQMVEGVYENLQVRERHIIESFQEEYDTIAARRERLQSLLALCKEHLSLLHP